VADTILRLENRPVGDVASWRVVAEFLSGLPLESPPRQVRLEPPR
jgi:hypothetical protein